MGGQYLTSILLEFSEEDLSDTTPTWIDVTQDLIAADWWAGVDSEGSDPDAGGATLVMRNRGRRWEPDYVAGQFYPNITYARRFRLTLDDAAGSPVQEGLWYIRDIAIDYPLGTDVSIVTFTCSDGVEVMAMDSLPLMNPPDANAYPDVIAFDQPWGYWRLGDPEGTQATAIIRTDHWNLHGPKGTKRKYSARYGPYGTRYSTRSEAGAAGGPAGVYKNTPTLGAEGLILGDGDTAVLFTASESEWAQIPVEADTFVAKNAVTLEAWFKPNTMSHAHVIISGPRRTASSQRIFILDVQASGDVSFDILGGPAATAGAGTVTVDNTFHLVGTWDGTTSRLYVNGVLENEVSNPGVLLGADTNMFIYIGREEITAGSPDFADGVIDEVAVYEYALTAERVLAHYQAGAERGYPQQTAGARIADIATHALWSEASIQTTGRDVLPQMKAGQSKMAEIGELAHAEGPRTMFFFNGTGDPVYLGHEWQASSSSYNITQVTLGTLETEVSYEALDLDYDNEVYNEVTVSHVAGDPATAGDGTPPPRRENTEFTDVLLMEHNHVESLAAAVLAFYESPQLRPTRVTLNGAEPTRLNHILRRDIGHQIRIKQRGEGGTPIDRITNIIGKRKGLTSDGHLTCEWTLGRGFNAADGFWHAGVVGASEAGTTTVAA